MTGTWIESNMPTLARVGRRGWPWLPWGVDAGGHLRGGGARRERGALAGGPAGGLPGLGVRAHGVTTRSLGHAGGLAGAGDLRAPAPCPAVRGGCGGVRRGGVRPAAAGGPTHPRGPGVRRTESQPHPGCVADRRCRGPDDGAGRGGAATGPTRSGCRGPAGGAGRGGWDRMPGPGSAAPSWPPEPPTTRATSPGCRSSWSPGGVCSPAGYSLPGSSVLAPSPPPGGGSCWPSPRQRACDGPTTAMVAGPGSPAGTTACRARCISRCRSPPSCSGARPSGGHCGQCGSVTGCATRPTNPPHRPPSNPPQPTGRGPARNAPNRRRYAAGL